MFLNQEPVLGQSFPHCPLGVLGDADEMHVHDN